MKKTLTIFLLILLAFSFAACEKKGEAQKEETTEETMATEGQQTQQEDPRETIAKQLSQITLEEKDIDHAVEKLPSWIEISSKYAQQLQAIQDMGQVQDVSFVDKVPGMRDDLKKADIDPETFFPLLEKTLQGHMFVKNKEMFAERKEEFEQNKQRINEMMKAPDITDEQKLQYQQVLENMDKEAELLKGTPPGFTEAEMQMIEAKKDQIDSIIEKIQQQAAQQQQAAAQAQMQTAP